jgi:hypothetical protein
MQVRSEFYTGQATAIVVAISWPRVSPSTVFPLLRLKLIEPGEEGGLSPLNVSFQIELIESTRGCGHCRLAPMANICRERH